MKKKESTKFMDGLKLVREAHIELVKEVTDAKQETINALEKCIELSKNIERLKKENDTLRELLYKED